MAHRLTYRDVFFLIVIVALTILVYSSAIHFEFTNWDDDIHVTNNPAIQDFSLRSMIDLFSPTEKYMYHPLTMLSYMIEWKVAGAEPWLFHGTNISLHAVNVCLVFFLLFQLSRNNYLSLFIAFLFALHPLQIESVAWISARKDLLSGFFMLGSAVCYYRWKERNDTWIYITSIVLFTLSLFSKPSAVVLPLIFVIIDFSGRKKIAWRLFKDTFVYFTLSAIFTSFVVLTNTSHSPLPIQLYSLPQKIVLIAYEIGFYIFKFFVPANLSACYSYPLLNNGSMPIEYYIGIVIVMTLVVLFIYFGKTLRSVALGYLLYGILLLPVLQFIPFNNASVVADRYAYLAIVGLSFSFFTLVEIIAAATGLKKITIIAGATVLFSSLCYATIDRLPVWSDSISLFSDVIKKNPNTAIAYGNRANAKIAKRDYYGAIEDCNKFIVMIPEEPRGYYNRGNAYSEMANAREATTDYTKSIMLGFLSPNVFYNRGNQYLKMEKYDSAATDYETVLRLSPAYLAALLQLDFISTVTRKNYIKSVYYLSEYLKYEPNDAAILMRRARAYAKLGQFGAALQDAALAVSLNNGGDATDRFFTDLNSIVDSISTKISALSARLPEKDRNARKKIYRDRSVLYWSLGDTLRSKNDLFLSGIDPVIIK